MGELAHTVISLNRPVIQVPTYIQLWCVPLGHEFFSPMLLVVVVLLSSRHVSRDTVRGCDDLDKLDGVDSSPASARGRNPGFGRN